jgi:hypothetical protein
MCSERRLAEAKHGRVARTNVGLASLGFAASGDGRFEE